MLCFSKHVQNMIDFIMCAEKKLVGSGCYKWRQKTMPEREKW